MHCTIPIGVCPYGTSESRRVDVVVAHEGVIRGNLPCVSISTARPSSRKAAVLGSELLQRIRITPQVLVREGISKEVCPAVLEEGHRSISTRITNAVHAARLVLTGIRGLDLTRKSPAIARHLSSMKVVLDLVKENPVGSCEGKIGLGKEAFGVLSGKPYK